MDASDSGIGQFHCGDRPKSIRVVSEQERKNEGLVGGEYRI